MPVTTQERLEFIVADAPVGTPEDPLVRMQEDLRRAIKKPENQRHWVMALDLRKCVGCAACTVACVVENKLPPGVVYRPVLEEELGAYPNVTRRFVPRPCMQCDNPPCVNVCPVNATFKRPDGIVAVNYNECIGCRYCLTACPYSARTFDSGRVYLEGTPGTPTSLVGRPKVEAYEKLPAYEYGQSWERKHDDSPIGNARKCQFCSHRLNAGMLPACATTCIGRATYFGDASDHASLVAQLIAMPNVMRLKEEMGTEPKVYYLV